jgi:D-sedoheptulose 7-phosphate isomerase
VSSLHLTRLAVALADLERDVPRLHAWGSVAGAVLASGGRLLACGNGGSCAQAQHLTAELTGRYETDRRPLAAIPLTADMCSVTAISNDYGYGAVFARQVHAHGRPGDILVCLSASGSSANVVAAARAAGDCGMTAWALTGPAPNPLADACTEAIAVPAAAVSTVQEVHLAAIHILCAAVDAAISSSTPPAREHAI